MSSTPRDAAPESAADAATDAPRCMPSSLQPAPRGDAAGVVDPMSGNLYVFGGDVGRVVNCMAQPEFSGETWRYDTACDRWTMLAPGEAPSARARSASALDTRRRRMIVFGGRYREGSSGAYTLYQDVWAFDLAAERWTQLMPTGDAPSARANAAAAYDAASDTVYVFGGNTSTSGLSFSPRNDVFALDLGANAWRRVTATGTAPTARLFHAAVVAGRSLVVYGGGGANAFTGPFYGDVWRLDLASSAWSRLALSGDNGALGNRITASLYARGAGGDFAVVAGHDDGALGNRNDVLTVSSTGAVTLVREGDSINRRGNGFCDFPADFATTDEESPERRSAFVLAADPARSRAIVYGGKTDCGLAGDVWSLDLNTGAWRPLRASTDGLSCQRSGRTNCRTLCN